MFSIPRPNVIESDDGFSVEVLGRSGLLYSEAQKSMKVDSEVLMGPSGLVVYASSINRWSAPYDLNPLDEFEKERILSNIKSALKFRELDIEVIY